MTTATFTLFASGTGSLTIAGQVHAVRGTTLDEARANARRIVAEHAAATAAPVTMTATEPDGRTFTIEVHADGSITAPQPHTETTEQAPAPTPEQPAPPAEEPTAPRTLRHPRATTRHEAAPPATAPAASPAADQPLPPPIEPVAAPAPAVPQAQGQAPAPTPAETVAAEPAPTRRELREKARSTSLLTASTNEAPAATGWRGALNAMGARLAPSQTERADRVMLTAVSRHFTGPRTIAVVNGKGGSTKTPATILLAAVFARHGGAGVVALDNNATRGTLGWRTQPGSHDASIADLLPQVDRLLSTTARAAEMEAYVHHQAEDRYDVVRSRPEVLADEQPTDAGSYNRVHEVLAKYYRLVLVDSGNDESAASWRAMIASADAIVVPTITRPEHAESARLLLAELARADAHSADLAENALVIVSQASKAEPSPEELVTTFKSITRDAVAIPYDPAMAGRPLLLDSLRPATRRAWVTAGASLAGALDH